MALNFPANTSLPYVDPVSKLKYIYNPAVGAWEAAIQPPAIIAENPPALDIPGFLWWDSVSGSLYIWYEDADGGQWVDAAPGGAGAQTGKAVISQEAPEDPNNGELWWNSADGRLYLWYDDGSSKQWIQATTGTNGDSVINYGIRLTSGTTAPTAPKLHDLWYNTTEKTLYLSHKAEGETISSWIKAHNVTDPAAVVNAVTGTGSVSVSGTAKDPVISVRDASFSSTGVVSLASVSEAKIGLINTKALTPGTLKESINSYLPASASATAGIISLSTTAEVVAGTVSNKAITPLTLKEALPNLGVTFPVGSVIEFAGSTAPTGYLQCNGALVSRTTYSDLFSVIGTTYGIGDGATTFKLPSLLVADVIKCIKF